ncbi:Stealth CR1 domain-containing protein [Psychrobacter sp. NG254]|uniref:Stealth CR1 domain-containing protein n=1 Tax=Psychrobacter sp. NG254 TaxID=2782003 RepID=UPI00188900B3|nr:Stealth CR1 domain-containing protein [Psychrobacter sp. NG254]MBF2718720.1 Stealth CR1 domain-containing protein [Psychrobacter sp. NG254]
MKQPNDKTLDVVIAWVDGTDPILKQKREQYKSGKTVASDAVTATRFASDDEIYYNIASIIKYVPFVRHIYIVTDQQQPEFIDEFANQNICSADTIRVVDHKDIFSGYEQFLPTFNTRSIETMIWNIKGLSDYFIYMNDDFFFNQPVVIDDFLDAEKLMIHGHWRKNAALNAKLNFRKSRFKLFGTPIQPRHTIAQMLSAKILGMDQFFEIHHYPHIVDKTILKDHLLAHPQLLTEQIKYKFRDVAQVNPITLMNHLKIQKDEAHLKPETSINYLKNKDSVENFVLDLEDKTIKYGCIQSLDLLEPDLYQKISQAMRDKFSEYLPNSVAGHTSD